MNSLNFSRNSGIVLLIAAFLWALMDPLTGGLIQPAHAELEGSLSGNLGVVSDYYFRGSNDNNGAAVQGGLDYSHPSGFYAGYWASPVDFGVPEGPGGEGNAVENDLYAGYTGQLSNEFSYDIGLIQYLYANQNAGPDGEDSDANEGYLSLSKGPFSITGNYSFTDADWTRAGDIYVTASYATDVAYGFDLKAKAGWYSYDSALITGGEPVSDDEFRDAVITLSHPIGETGAEMNLQFIQIGDSRSGINVNGPAEEDFQVIIGLSYGFGIEMSD